VREKKMKKYVVKTLYKILSELLIVIWLDKNKNKGYTTTLINAK